MNSDGKFRPQPSKKKKRKKKGVVVFDHYPQTSRRHPPSYAFMQHCDECWYWCVHCVCRPTGSSVFLVCRNVNKECALYVQKCKLEVCFVCAEM